MNSMLSKMLHLQLIPKVIQPTLSSAVVSGAMVTEVCKLKPVEEKLAKLGMWMHLNRDYMHLYQMVHQLLALVEVLPMLA